MTRAFQAVLDETGYRSADPADIFAFAGYIAQMDDWEEFIRACFLIITSNPELNDPKKFKQLVRWERRKSDPRIMRLARIITDNPKFGSIRWRLPYRDYRSVIHDPVNQNMYRFAWQGVLIHLLATIRPSETANSNETTSLDLFYDQNIQEEPKVQEGYAIFYAWASKQRPEVAAMLPRRPTPKTDDDFWPLRMADAIAWNTHRAFWMERKGKRFATELWLALSGGAEAINDTYTAQDLREILGRA